MSKSKKNSISSGVPKCTDHKIDNLNDIHFQDYTPSLVAEWLTKRGIPTATCDVLLRNDIDGLAFPMLTEDDLREMNFVNVGLRKRILWLSSNWRKMLHDNSTKGEHASASKHTADNNIGVGADPTLSLINERDIACFTCCAPVAMSQMDGSEQNLRHTERRASFSSAPKFEISQMNAVELHTKPWKVVASAVYVFLVFGLSSFVMVLAHERLPDMSKYPPLPDILLDNLPYIPWAFKAAEMVCLILVLIWLVILFFHQHRCILLRRYFSLMGTVFLLRSVTMIITSLSVPGHHLAEKCKPQYYNSMAEKVNRALEIWFGLGMSLRGVVTCGDYMFSGHTTCLTLLNFFITEYTPRTMHQLHTFTWVLNIFGVFFILAGHEHYSIDVFIACYISSRLFLYYHCLANNNSLMHRDKGRAMIWFPLFSFFESDVCEVVPNEYSIPFFNRILCIWSDMREWSFSNSIAYTSKKNKNFKASTPQPSAPSRDYKRL